MKLLILSAAGYPSMQDPYSAGFVHTRVLEYIQKGMDCIVFVPTNMTKVTDSQYEFEGVNIHVGGLKELHDLEADTSPEVILVHFTHPIVFKYLKSRPQHVPMVFWVHGYGAIGWFRYFFEMKFEKEYLIDLYVSTRNLIQFHFLAKHHEKRNIYFIFVSHWMHRVTSFDTLSTFSNYRVIPNPIDERLFSYSPKSVDMRKKILLIRSFANKKYANDLAVKAIQELSVKPFFKELEFAIYGKGRYFQQLTDPLRKYDNVKIENRFLLHHEIAELHKHYGVFLCPTRMDAQGVSMCEAMMSGLVPVTSNSTAIPEFVRNDVDGFLSNNFKEIAQSIEFIYANPEKYLAMSKSAHHTVSLKAGKNEMISQELNYIQSLLS